MSNYTDIVLNLEKDDKQIKNDKEEYILSKIYDNFSLKYQFSDGYKGFEIPTSSNAVDSIINELQQLDIMEIVQNECKKIQVLLDEKNINYTSKLPLKSEKMSAEKYILHQLDNEKLVRDVSDNKIFLERKYRDIIDALQKENMENIEQE